MKNMPPDQRHNELFAKVKVSQQTLMCYTGFSINKITSGTDALEEFGLIETESHRTKAYYIKRPLKQAKQETIPGIAPISAKRRRKRDKNPENATSKANVYWLRNPERMPIGALSLLGQPGEGGSLETKGQINVIPTNGLKYFTFPSCIITQTDERWPLAHMSGSEIRLYFSICWLSNKQYTRTNNDFEVKVADLRRLSGLRSPKTFAKALEGLQLDRRLIQIWPSEKTSRNGESKTIRLELCDPLTGNPIVMDWDPRNQPGNYRLKGRTKRPTLNVLDPKDIEKAIYDSNEERGAAVTQRANGEMVMKCPFHPDDTPSLCANSRKNGCWYCHGCNRKGNVFELLAGLTATAIGDSIQSLAATKGIEVEYQDPDRGATVYRYMTEDGKKILKEVVTRIKDGQKTITQRRPGPSGHGFINDADGVPPSL
jgi:hypothetical protein